MTYYKENLIEKYHFTHDPRVLNTLVAQYGIKVLFEFDTHGIDILARMCIEDNTQFQNMINGISDEELTLVLQQIYSIYVNENIYMKFDIYEFISSLVFLKRNRKRNNVFLVFVLSIIEYERKRRVDESKDELDAVLDAFILDNESVDLVSIYTLSESAPEIYTYIVSNLEHFFNITSINDLVFAIVDIFNRLYDLLANEQRKNVAEIQHLYFSTILVDKTEEDIPMSIEESISKFLHDTLQKNFFTLDNDFFDKEIATLILKFRFDLDRSIIQYNSYYIFVIQLIFDVIKNLKTELHKEYVDYINIYEDVPMSDIIESLDLKDLRGVVYSLYFREILNNYPIISYRESYIKLVEEIDIFLLQMQSNGIDISL